MSINLGTLTPSAIKLGTTDVAAMYVGVSQVWPVAPTDPYLKVWVDAGNASSYSGTGNTWYDLSGNNNNLALNGSPSYDATTGSFYFPQSTSVYANNTSLTDTNVGTGDASVEIWQRYLGPNDNTYYIPCEWGQSDNIDYDLGGIDIAYGDDGLGDRLFSRVGGIRLQYIIPTYYDSITYDKTTDYNVWRQVVITRQNTTGNVNMYVNGSLYRTINGMYANVINQYDKLYVGSNNPANPFGGQLPFLGDVAILKLWNGKVLDATEVTANWNASKTRFGY